MTDEDKKLLLIDLCARLPYGVIVNTPQNIFYSNIREDVKLDNVFEIDGNFYVTEDCGWPIETCKPYLRPMSNMTEEEKNIYYNDNNRRWNEWEWTDWLNSHYFDYRGLIPMGLALEAPEDMYK